MATSNAFAFGTVSLLGQNTEHERITRIALECKTIEQLNCFEPRTLDSLAGKKGTFGAVGAPDPGPTLFRFFAHCSGGDFLPTFDYPRSKEKARQALELCRKYMIYHLNGALTRSEELLDEQGNLKTTEIPKAFPCGFAEKVDNRAKCQILKHLGAMLHAAQDFYAHSNWVDIANQNEPLGRFNPPGLEKRGPAPWLNLRISDPEFPEGLISGCGGIDAVTDGEGGCTGRLGKKRVDHATLNKDNGDVVPGSSVGKTPRGRLNNNFRFAVDAAIEDTSDKWQTLIELLIATYGEANGHKMICIIVSDDAETTCK
ncbi:MAG: hypothetical protein QNJ29_12545 [Rhizobiaceae bacterium]|nr:hypothetical protein [Rhizobiaceae bacterium]